MITFEGLMPTYLNPTTSRVDTRSPVHRQTDCSSHDRSVLRSDHLSRLLRHRSVSGDAQPPPPGHERPEVGNLSLTCPDLIFHPRVPASLKYLVFEVLAKVLCIKLNKEKKRKSKAARAGGELEETQPACVFCLASPTPPAQDIGRSR